VHAACNELAQLRGSAATQDLLVELDAPPPAITSLDDKPWQLYRRATYRSDDGERGAMCTKAANLASSMTVR